jgi:hypothetical protein
MHLPDMTRNFPATKQKAQIHGLASRDGPSQISSIQPAFGARKPPAKGNFQDARGVYTPPIEQEKEFRFDFSFGSQRASSNTFSVPRSASPSTCSTTTSEEDSSSEEEDEEAEASPSPSILPKGPNPKSPILKAQQTTSMPPAQAFPFLFGNGQPQQGQVITALTCRLSTLM